METILKASFAVPYFDIKSRITPASGVTINNAILYVCGGRIAQLYLDVKFSSPQTANTSYNIGTLASAVRPKNLAALGSTYGAGQIDSSGVISFRPQMALNANSDRYFAATFLLNTPYTG